MFTTAKTSRQLEIQLKAPQRPLYFSVWTYGLNGLQRKRRKKNKIKVLTFNL